MHLCMCRDIITTNNIFSLLYADTSWQLFPPSLHVWRKTSRVSYHQYRRSTCSFEASSGGVVYLSATCQTFQEDGEVNAWFLYVQLYSLSLHLHQQRFRNVSLSSIQVYKDHSVSSLSKSEHFKHLFFLE